MLLETTQALSVCEWPFYPEYYVPMADMRPEALVDENDEERLDRGTA